MNYIELAEQLGTTPNTIKKDFARFCSKQAEKGILVKKEGRGDKANYTVEKIPPQSIPSYEFSSRVRTEKEIFSYLTKEEIQNEKWIPCYFYPKIYEVSDLGRIRRIKDKKFLLGTDIRGYTSIVLFDSSKYQLHRLILQSWDPKPEKEFNQLIVDHINGIRNDNRLTNLRWGTSEENTLWMNMNRKEITTETTRLINKYGYEKTLEILKSIK